MSESSQSAGSGRTPAIDEILRRVGRNLVIYQQVEHTLKQLMTHARFGAPASQFEQRFSHHAESIQLKTMGDLAGRLVETVLGAEQSDPAPTEIDEAWVGFHFRIESDGDSVKHQESALRSLVQSRNELVHRFLPRWVDATAGQTDAVLVWLDEQREAAVATLERLQGWQRTVHDARKLQAALLTSDLFSQRLELAHLRGSRLVAMLGQIAMAPRRPDGWTSLATACQLIRRDAPDELKDLQLRYGYPNVTKIVQATEIFDICSEAVREGGSRTIYRIKDDWLTVDIRET